MEWSPMGKSSLWVTNEVFNETIISLLSARNVSVSFKKKYKRVVIRQWCILSCGPSSVSPSAHLLNPVTQTCLAVKSKSQTEQVTLLLLRVNSGTCLSPVVCWTALWWPTPPNAKNLELPKQHVCLQVDWHPWRLWASLPGTQLELIVETHAQVGREWKRRLLWGLQSNNALWSSDADTDSGPVLGLIMSPGHLWSKD